MNKDEFIGAQAFRIQQLETEVADMHRSIADAMMHMICIGGPLNDNKLGYSKEQLGPFFRIQGCLERAAGSIGEDE